MGTLNSAYSLWKYDLTIWRILGDMSIYSKHILIHTNSILFYYFCYYLTLSNNVFQF